MPKTVLRWAGAAFIAFTFAPAMAQLHSNMKRAISLAPSAELNYSIKARQHGFSLSGDAVVTWRAADNKYSIVAETRAALLGTILENRSEGLIDSYGIAPATFYEKRFRKGPSTTTFNRAAKTITFTDAELSYPIKGGEQDRSSAPWQLVALARAAPDRFSTGSEWIFFVAGRRDAEPWSFKVVGTESVHTGIGELSCVHLVKAPPPDSQDQQVDIWLAPSREWYPVRLRFTDNSGEYVEQTLEKITKK